MSDDDTALVPILIAGPTAGGKSALALTLAQRLNGCIINADSMQVYDTLCELTARPSAEDERRAPHRLYGHIPVSAPYNVGRWQRQAKAEINAAQRAGHRPIIVGGTGLYFESLTDGLVDIPAIDEAVRAQLRQDLHKKDGLPTLYERLRQVDLQLALRLEPTDKQRILRGLEVFHSTGTTLSDWQKITPKAPVPQAVKILLMPHRDWLYTRCNMRFEQMLQGRAIAEVEQIWALNLPPDCPPMKALGVADIIAQLTGEIDRETMIAQAQQATRRYAKRQMTWFRNRMADWQTFNEQDYENNPHKIFSFISKNTLTTI